jgi:hypothetical protein
MAFNNGQGREYSSIIEIESPLDTAGEYVLDDEGRFGPRELTWEYVAENKKDFYSGFISGATRLPNGNTFICEGATGRFFEVNREGEKLWEHVNTFGGELTMEGRPNDAEGEAKRLLDAKEKRPFVENNALFRATKILPSHLPLARVELEPLSEQPIPFADLVSDAVARLKAAAPEQPATEQPVAGGEVTTVEEPAAKSDAKSGEAKTQDAGRPGKSGSQE